MESPQSVDVEPNIATLTRLLKFASLISRPMQDAVAAHNRLSLNELRVVMCLGGEGALAGHEITEMMAITTMNVSRALASLAERDWIEPAPDPANRRRKPVRLSPHGCAAYRAMTPDVGDVADFLLSRLTKKELAGLDRTIEKVIARIDDWPMPNGADADANRRSKLDHTAIDE